MNTQKFFFRVANTTLTALCYLFYNPGVQVAMVRMFS
jgi:hypothetical protein